MGRNGVEDRHRDIGPLERRGRMQAGVTASNDHHTVERHRLHCGASSLRAPFGPRRKRFGDAQLDG